MDEQRFDDLARRLASVTTRRSILRAAVGGVAGGVLSLAGVKRAAAGPCPGGAPACNGFCCSACEKCQGAGPGNKRCVSNCSQGRTCVDGQCGCPDGQPLCGGSACCEGEAVCVDNQCACPANPGGECHDKTSSGPVRVNCCAACEICAKGTCKSTCPSGQFCGTSGQCQCVAPGGEVRIACGVSPNVRCCDGACEYGVCTCPSGQSLCGGDACCDTCQECKNGTCVDSCPGKTACDGQCRCPDGQPVCGKGSNASCCEEGATCVSGACVCPAGNTPCVTGVKESKETGVRHVRCCDSCETCTLAGGGDRTRVCQSGCQGGAICTGGQCVCPPGKAICGAGVDAVCCDTLCEVCKGGSSRPRCESKCPDGLSCSGNQCVCPDGQPVCGKGSRLCCAGGAVCANGSCVCPENPRGVCETKTGVGSDPRRVTCCSSCEDCTKTGDCTSTCPATQVCDAGGQCLCPDDRPACQGVCCGACQVCGASGCEACPATLCLNGICGCTGTQTPCGSGCCDLDSGQTCVDDACLCPDGSPVCRAACCDASMCQVCGPNGCTSNCSGSCQDCVDGTCQEIVCEDDGDPCTVNSCDAVLGGCVAAPIPDCCQEDADCPGEDNPCVTPICNLATNRCSVEPAEDGIECGDGDPCTGPSVCDSGACGPGASLCGSCQVCTESGCAASEDGGDCPHGSCCGGACLPACPEPKIRGAGCSCVCSEIACDPGSELDPTTCVCCRTVCGPDECGDILDGCGGTLTCTEGCCIPTTCEAEGVTCGTIEDGCDGVLDCGPCITCGACTPFGAPCGAAGPCCSGYCDEVSGLCRYANAGSPDGYCFEDGEPCPDEEDYWDGLLLGCCRACVDGCCGCVSLGAACAQGNACCGEEATCYGFPGPNTCCLRSGGSLAAACTSGGECCSGRCASGICGCALDGEPCSTGQVECCEGSACFGFDEVLGSVCARL